MKWENEMENGNFLFRFIVISNVFQQNLWNEINWWWRKKLPRLVTSLASNENDFFDSGQLIFQRRGLILININNRGSGRVFDFKDEITHILRETHGSRQLEKWGKCFVSDQENLWSHRNKLKYSQFFANQKKENFALSKFWRRLHYTNIIWTKPHWLNHTSITNPCRLRKKCRTIAKEERILFFQLIFWVLVDTCATCGTSEPVHRKFVDLQKFGEFF